MEIELNPNETLKPNSDEKDLVGTSFTAMGNGRSFNKILKGVEVLSVKSPTILAVLTLTEEHMNDMGMMHTGFAAAMADILTAATVRITAAKQSPIVSVDLSVTFLQPARIGDTVLMEATCLRADRSIAFTEAIFRRRNDGELILKANQQLAILHYLPLAIKSKGNDNAGVKGKKEQQNECKNMLEDANSCNGFVENAVQKGTDETADKKARHLIARMTNSKNFNRMAEKLAVTRVDSTLFEVDLELGSEHLNEGGTMHGGFIASIVDIASVCAIGMAAPTCSTASMFVSISYMMPAKIGENVVVKSEALKLGRNIAFMETTISRKRDGVLLAKGKHTIQLTRQGEERKN